SSDRSEKDLNPAISRRSSRIPLLETDRAQVAPVAPTPVRSPAGACGRTRAPGSGWERSNGQDFSSPGRKTRQCDWRRRPTSHPGGGCGPGADNDGASLTRPTGSGKPEEAPLILGKNPICETSWSGASVNMRDVPPYWLTRAALARDNC